MELNFIFNEEIKSYDFKSINEIFTVVINKRLIDY